jgi:hypothetical protein
MLDAVNDGAPFRPLGIHVDPLCRAMAPAAIYIRRPSDWVRSRMRSVVERPRAASVQLCGGVKFDVSKTAKASKAAGVLARLHGIVETSRCRVESWNVRARADAGSSWVVAVSPRDAV